MKREREGREEGGREKDGERERERNYVIMRCSVIM